MAKGNPQAENGKQGSLPAQSEKRGARNQASAEKPQRSAQG